MLGAAVSIVSLALFVAPGDAAAQAGIPYLAQPDRREPPKKPEPAPPAESTATQAPATPALEQTAGKPFSFFAELWARRRAALERGGTREAAQLLSALVEAKLAAGWPDIFVYGEALVHEAAAAAAAGDSRSALQLAQASVALAPHAPGSHHALARARWAAGLGVLSTLGAAWDGLGVSLTEPPLLRVQLGNLLAAFALGALAAAAALTLATLYRHSRLLFHDLHHLLPPGATRLQATLLGIAMLLTPVFLRQGPVWAVLVWLVMLSPYYARRERAGAVAVLALLGALAFALPHVTSHLAWAGSRSQDVYLTVRDAAAQDAAERLRARPVLPEELYALGLRARWSGQLVEARQWLDRAAAALADEDLLVTAGNVRYSVGDKPGALAAYERALQVDEESAAALFNVSRVHYSMMEHQKAGEAHRRAMELDYDLVEELSEAAKRASGIYLVDGGVPRRLLDVRLEYGRGHWRSVMRLWSLAGGGTTRLTFGVVALVAAAFVLAMGFVRRALRPAALCPRCGMAACRRCSPEMPSQEQCGQCFHAFLDKAAVDPQQVIRKELEVHRYRARQMRARQVLAILLAGSGQLLRGSFLRGLLYMAGFAALGLVVLWATGVLPELVPTEGGPRWLAAGLAGAGMLVLYLVSAWDGLREER